MHLASVANEPASRGTVLFRAATDSLVGPNEPMVVELLLPGVARRYSSERMTGEIPGYAERPVPRLAGRWHFGFGQFQVVRTTERAQRTRLKNEPNVRLLPGIPETRSRIDRIYGDGGQQTVG